MKQHITIEQLNELSNKGREKEWWDHIADGCSVLPLEMACDYHKKLRAEKLKEFEQMSDKSKARKVWRAAGK